MATQSKNAELTRCGLAGKEVQHRLEAGKVRDVDYADLYFESGSSESVMEAR